MNALVRKEVRVIAPAWGMALLAMAAGAAASSVFSIEAHAFCLMTFWLAMTLLGLSSFGLEFSSGSFSSLLAQPVSRKRLWQVKSRWVGVAAISLFGLSLILWVTLSDIRSADADWGAFLAGSAVGLAMLTGGLWTTLAFRQTTAAFWITLLIPGALALGVAQLTEWLTAWLEPTMQNATPNPQSIIPLAVTVLMIFYSIAGYWWARRLFLLAQDVGWVAAEAPVPGFTRWFKIRTRPVGEPFHRPLRALAVKEFQLHSLSLFFAAGVLVLHLAAIGVRNFGEQSGGWREAAYLIWALWFILPFIAGAEAVASERQLGTMEGQLCLPARRRAQFVLKLMLTMAAGVILGGVMPWLLENFASLFGVGAEVLKRFYTEHSVWEQSNLAVLMGWSAIAGGMALMAFHASTLTRSTLQAMGGAVVGWILVWLLILFGARPEVLCKTQLWRGWLFHWIGALTLVPAVIGLAYWNFKRLHQSGQLWRRNLAVLGVWLAFTVAATSAVYYRTWELVISPEPRHGPVRIVGSGQAKLCVAADRLFILLPDGRIWAATNHDNSSYPLTGAFLSGSNWVDLVGGPFAVAALQADGSLRSLYQVPRTVYRTTSSSPGSSSPEARLLAKPSASPEAPPAKVGEQIREKVSPPAATATNLSTEESSQWMAVEGMPPFRRRYGIEFGPGAPSPQIITVHWRAISSPERIGTDSDWKSLAAGRGHFLALKQDGSLWGWGDNTEGQLGEGSEWFANGPTRIGKDNDWVAVFASPAASAGVKRDGSLWKWGYLYQLPDGKTLRKGTAFTSPVRWNLPGTNLVQLQSEAYYDLALYADGSAQAVGMVPRSLLRDAIGGGPEASRMDYWRTSPVHLGATGDWSRILLGEILVGLKRDGTLWKQVVQQPWNQGESKPLLKLSGHSNWIGILSQNVNRGQTVTALAADGTLCCWYMQQSYAQNDPRALLGPSRRPLWSMNILDAAK